MLIYTIYKCADTYIVGEWYISPGQDPQPGKAYAAISLEQARRVAAQDGRARVEPDPDDDPRTVESWL